VYAAIEGRRPIAAVYHELPRLFLSAPAGTEQGGTVPGSVLSIRREERERSRAAGISGQLALHCSGKAEWIELLDGPWRTAPNHSRPASCIVDPDIDADDYPERDPQQGQ
jgi:hypothetical protein